MINLESSFVILGSYSSIHSPLALCSYTLHWAYPYDFAFSISKTCWSEKYIQLANLKDSKFDLNDSFFDPAHNLQCVGPAF